MAFTRSSVRARLAPLLLQHFSRTFVPVAGKISATTAEYLFTTVSTEVSVSSTIGSEVGKRAPEIDLPDGNGERWQLSAARGHKVVLLFYPGDETPVCTKQLCSVRDNWSRYQQTGAEVVGINTESVAKHRGFAQHHDLPLRLLSDAEGTVVRAYDMKNLLGTRRGVVVIDAEGVICYRRVVFPVFRPGDDEVIAAIQKCR